MVSAIPLTVAEQAEDNDTEETDVEISEEYDPDDTVDVDVVQENDMPVQEESIDASEEEPEE